MVSIRRLPILFTLGLWLLSTPFVAAAPRDELLPLVPDDVSLCLVVNNLRDHGQNLAKASWLDKVRNTALGKAFVKSEEFQKLLKIDQDLKQVTSVGWKELREDILGDCVVFAYQNAAKKEDERGLVLLWAKDDKLLANLIAAINKEQQKNDEIKTIEEKEYKGVKYYMRREAAGPTHFYWQQESLFAFTTHEPLLRQVIDRQKAPAKNATPLVQSFARLPVKQALLTLWINPRAFDPLWESTAAESPDAIFAKKAFHQYWKALDAVAVSLNTGQDFELSVTLQGRLSDLPVPAQKFLQTAAEPSELWHHFPAKAIFTTATRVDFEALFQVVEGFLPAEARKKFRDGVQMKAGTLLSRDFVQEVLPCLGPDVGFCLAPHAGGKAIPDMLFALRIKPGTKEPPVDQAIFQALHDSAIVAKAFFNGQQKDIKEHLQIESQNQAGIEVKYLTQRQFPDGFQPAFALKNGYLVLASSPGAIQRFTPQAVKIPAPPLLQLSFPELAKLLTTHRNWVLENIAGKNGLPNESAAPILNGVIETLTLVDYLNIQQQAGPGQITWTTRLQMTK